MYHTKITATHNQYTQTLVLMDAQSAPMTAGQRTRAQDMGARYVFKTGDIRTLPKYVEKALLEAGFKQWAKLGHTSYVKKVWGIK